MQKYVFSPNRIILLRIAKMIIRWDIYNKKKKKIPCDCFLSYI
jgi:hypothetical protein